MRSIFHYCQGDSHKSLDKPCQDFAYAESNPDLSMAIVSDGHGGEPYFRSQIGSRVAANVTKDTIIEFLGDLKDSVYKKDQPLFIGKHFTDYICESQNESIVTPEHNALLWLFSSIINKWNEQISLHALKHDLTEWELNHVEQQYLDEFIAKRQDPDATYEKTYGCTLMAYVQTKDFWFAFHIGDGKFVAFDESDGKLSCSQPIPWDERCFLNKTTSLCDSNAIDRFRYCYQGDGHFPLAVFLGSDGLDDSYGDGKYLYSFYIEIFKLLMRKGEIKTLKTLMHDLPVISKMGSKDDMSVASIYDDKNPIDTFLMLSRYQESQLQIDSQSQEQIIQDLNQKINDFGDPDDLIKSKMIDLQYAKNDLQRAEENRRIIRTKLSLIKRERTLFKRKNGINEE